MKLFVIITTEFAIANKRLIGKCGFIRRRSIEQHLSSIDSATVDQGIFGRIFNFGWIVTGNAGSAQGIDGIAKPLELRNKINTYIFENIKK